MSDVRKLILSQSFYWAQKRKAWNKTREKYMPVKKWHNLAESGRGSYHK